jgi:hypothetical protein
VWYHWYLVAYTENDLKEIEEGEEEDEHSVSVYVTQKDAFGIILILEKLLAKGLEDNSIVKAMTKISVYVPDHFKRMVKHTTLFCHSKY